MDELEVGLVEGEAGGDGGQGGELKVGEVAEGAVGDCGKVLEVQTGTLTFSFHQSVGCDDEATRNDAQLGDIDGFQELVVTNPDIHRLLESTPRYNPRIVQAAILDLERIDALHISQGQLPKTRGGDDFEGIEGLELGGIDIGEEGVVIEGNSAGAALEVVEREGGQV